MSDFDTVLERLLNEPSFAAALAGDPDLALAGYRLDPDEVTLLRSQVAGDSGADVAKVETRTNKSSTFGLLAPFAALGGVVDSFGHSLADPGHVAGLGSVPGHSEGLGSAPGHTSGLGSAPGHTSGFGSAPGADWGAGGSAPGAQSALGDAPAAQQGLGDVPAHQGLGQSPQQALGEPSQAHALGREIAPPQGYHPRVDADGDGTWDKATYRGRPDGGADILVDLNHDGKADFIGHDVDGDHKVDYADYDTDHDGVMDKRMYDDDNDGWLDRAVRKQPRN
jgi:hypothetical protein